MMECKKVVWKCDFCGHVASPESKRWTAITTDGFGNTIHVCGKEACKIAAAYFCEENGIDMKSFAK